MYAIIYLWINIYRIKRMKHIFFVIMVQIEKLLICKRTEISYQLIKSF